MAVNVHVQGAQAEKTASTPQEFHGKARRSEFRSAFLMTGLKMTGKSLGIVKTLVIAAVFGASGALDAFWVAYMLPQLMPGLVLGVVSTAFIPSFMRSTEQGKGRVDWRGLNTLFTLVAILVMTIAAIVVIARDPLVTLMAPGLPDDIHALAADLTALMAIAVLLFGMNSILSAVMQAMHRFGLMSLESVITNIVIIAGAVLFADSLGVHGLAYAVIAGFGLHTIVLLVANRDLVRHNLRPAFDFSHGDFRGSAAHMLPLLIGFASSIGMTIVDRMFVSTLDAGAISVLVYAGMIAFLPMEVFGHAVITAFYPGLSRNHVNGQILAMRDAHVRGVRLLLFIIVPTTLALVMASDTIISLLLERGAFTAEAGALTSATLAALALCLPVRAINYFNFRVFHARREPWTAVGIGVFGVCINIAFDMLLIGPLGVVGIALATSIAMAISAVVSTILLQRRQKISIVSPLLKPMAKLLVMTLVFGLTAYALLGMLDEWLSHLDAWLFMLLELATFIPAGILLLAAGYLLRFEEVHTLAAFVSRKPAEAS